MEQTRLYELNLETNEFIGPDASNLEQSYLSFSKFCEEHQKSIPTRRTWYELNIWHVHKQKYTIYTGTSKFVKFNDIIEDEE